jgi:cytochrome P450
VSFVDDLEELADRFGDDARRRLEEAVRLLEQRAREHPEPLFAFMRRVRPVLLMHGMAIVTQYDDVLEVLNRDEAFSVEPYRLKMSELAGDFILGTDDSPEYERSVSILRLAAPRSDIPRLAAYVGETAEALVAEAAPTGRLDVADLAKRVPARLVGRWFGTPGPDEDEFIAGALAMFEEIFVNLKNDPAISARAHEAAGALRAQLDEAIAVRKADGAGHADDVLGRLLAMQASEPSAFSDEEIRTNFIGLIVGFIPTVATATTFALNALLDRPDALESTQQAARSGDDDAVRAHMYEAMRLAPQGPGLFRRARTDCVIAEGTHHETRIPAGTLTFASTQSAMLDGDVVDDPEEFRTDRPPHHYLHFGTGLHECFGRFANAMQIPLIAKAVLRRPGLERAAGDEGQLVKAGCASARLGVNAGRGR